MQTATADEVTATFEIAPKLLQPWGIVHGGVYCSVVESVASTSGQIWLNSKGITDSHVVGVNNSTDFLRPTSDGVLEARAVPCHLGRRTHLWEVTLTHDGRVVAVSRLR
ncbi:MAG: esterase, partial [Gordonia sp. (in: high G+C Gram-positive bacteria)]